MTTPALLLGLFVLAGAPSAPSTPEPAGGEAQMSVNQTAQSNQADIRSGNAHLAISGDGTNKFTVGESTPAGFWPFVSGDVVQAINGHPVTKMDDILYIWREGAGSTFTFQVFRGGRSTTFTAGPADFPGLALPQTPTPPPPPPLPRRK